jgi:hypothetical protein
MVVDKIAKHKTLHKFLNINHNVLQIGGRFNAANVLLYAAFITNLI